MFYKEFKYILLLTNRVEKQAKLLRMKSKFNSFIKIAEATKVNTIQFVSIN